MPIKKPSALNVDVDMVPLIDIISLLLMFLVIVGDMAKSATAVKMKLPRLDQAVKDSPTEGRMVVQLEKCKDGRYRANIEGHAFELVPGGGNKTLLDYFQQIINARIVKGLKPGEHGEIDIPVKLRIPADASMKHVENVVMSLATARLVNVSYASAPKNEPPEEASSGEGGASRR
jgi:biopolymer transport protein ExbD